MINFCYVKKRINLIYLTHNYGSFYGQLQVSQGVSYQGYNTLHAVNLLSQEDVHGRQSSHFLKSRLHLYAQTEKMIKNIHHPVE